MILSASGEKPRPFSRSFASRNASIGVRTRSALTNVGIGGGFYAWNLTEAGDFIDFDTADLEIFGAGFETDGTTFGTYWQAGVEVPLASNWSVFFDTRWRRAKDNLEGDFDGLGELDLSGKSITFGAAFSY